MAQGNKEMFPVGTILVTKGQVPRVSTAAISAHIHQARGASMVLAQSAARRPLEMQGYPAAHK